ncbi:threonine dehydratase [Pandoraea sp.]|uniref:threonine dehydratase n=1 Tax=Pandoraea sp. TaxID=1883445 RepID=UPI00120FA53A|nr:threonine dehydratase [Pandoraea sp.]TAL54385.1 MAG: threonine dehydratase [Pandoraea sp.]TAM17435.1 MAG: threonine dehydratase [Pandoraea sp.]
MKLPDLDELEAAASLVYRQMQPTPQYVWPQISQHLGATVWLKHENHTPTGAFKVRGGITFIDWLTRNQPQYRAIVTATRGNHGQSQARAATLAGLRSTIVVPYGNSREKNAAIRSFGADLVEHGEDFDSARAEAMRIARDQGGFLVPPFSREVMLGVASYGLELFKAAPTLDTVYVPIGSGSGISGMIAARRALGLGTEIVGVVSTEAPAAKLSFEAGRAIETQTARTFADGLAVRVPVAEAFDIYARGAARIVAVSDGEIALAMRLLYQGTHNVVEGAGAASLAAAMQEKARNIGRTVGVILTGANIDSAAFARVLDGGIPPP